MVFFFQSRLLFANYAIQWIEEEVMSHIARENIYLQIKVIYQRIRKVKKKIDAANATQ